MHPLRPPSPISLGIAFAFALVATASRPARGQVDTAKEEQAFLTGIEAYIYGYPLVTMEMTRRVMTNARTVDGVRGPMGQLLNAAKYPTAAFRDVTIPNVDALYSAAWIDVGKKPYVFSLPSEGDRYYLMPLLSAWTEVFAVPGQRTTGGKAQKYAITGPHWKGKLPAGLTEFKSPTALVWILGRTYCAGTPEDYQAVHALQSHYSLVPITAYGKPYTPLGGRMDPQIDMRTPVRDQVYALDAAAYFTLLAQLLKDNPPSAADATMVAKLAEIGVEPGKEFDLRKLDPSIAKGLARVPPAATQQIREQIHNAGVEVNGWQIMTKTGAYGVDYPQRAFVAAVGLGADLPQDTVYPLSQVDADGADYHGANKYVLHFGKGETPPVKGFWSLTMYTPDYYFVDNPINRYAISSRDDLQYNDDGSLDIYIQKKTPGKAKESNWLPAAHGKFILMLRLYWPQETAPSILDGSWQPPAVRLAK